MRFALVAFLYFLMIPTFAEPRVKIDRVEVRKLVARWNDAHTLDNIEDLRTLYADRVYFYGDELSDAGCIAIKKSALTDRTYSQQIISPLQISIYTSGIIKCEFEKSVSKKGKVNVYRAYLLLIEIGDNGYAIVGESDMTTDKSIGRSPEIGSIVSPQAVNDSANEENLADEGGSEDLQNFVPLVASVGVSIVGLVFLYYWRRGYAQLKHKRKVPSNHQARFIQENLEKGHAFERYVVEQFDRPFFAMLDWKSDKSHRGVRPLSNSDPDLQYRFNFNGFTRVFAVECKYRSRVDTLEIDERQLHNYSSFSYRNGMPVYVVVGLGGEPTKPSEMYLIPLDRIRSTMTYQELKPFRKSSYFFYDCDVDRLT